VPQNSHTICGCARKHVFIKQGFRKDAEKAEAIAVPAAGVL